jgi:hypothetical protein
LGAPRLDPPATPLVRLTGAVRDASLDQLRLFAKCAAVRLEEVTVESLPFTQHLAHIMVVGPEIEISFKTHFMGGDALRFTKQKLGTAHATLPQGIDFMKEFCNLVAGKTKQLLEGHGFVMGQSLPFAIQGYNEIFYPRADDGTHHAAWRLTDAGGTVCCSVSAHVRKAECLTRLAGIEYRSEDQAAVGEVELF